MSDKAQNPYANMTNAELKRLLAERDQELNDQKETINVLQKEIKAINAKGAGWFVETMNPLYNGVTLGVQFAMGQAFISRDLKYSAGEIETLKDTYFEKHKYTEEEIKAVKEREAMSSAERVAIQMEADLGYAVTYFDGSESADEEIKKIVSQRTQEYNQALMLEQAREEALKATGAVPFIGGS